MKKISGVYRIEIGGKSYIGSSVNINQRWKQHRTNLKCGRHDNPYMQKKPQGKFVVVSVVVSNEQKDAVTVDASSFKLVDKDGREYSYSTEGQMAIQVGNGDAKGFLTSLNPGITTNFEIPYDVPKKLELSNITMKARGGMTGKEITLPLVVQKK